MVCCWDRRIAGLVGAARAFGHIWREKHGKREIGVRLPARSRQPGNDFYRFLH